MQVMTSGKAETAVKAGEPPSDALAVDSNCCIETLKCRDIPGFDDHKLVVSCIDQDNGLRAFIAIHSTTLGPALGGCRMWPYANEEEALADVLRLSQGMSYKHAVAGTSQGGGKAVIIGNPRKHKTDALFRAFGRFVDLLGGHYITAEDVGTTVDDMVCAAEQTEHVAGLPTEMGGSGDPSPVTAYGVFCGIKAAVRFQCGRTELGGVTVAVQGLGHVGYALCKHLHEAGAKLIVTDIHEANVKRVSSDFRAEVVEPNAVFDVEADVFAPCALGGTLSSGTVARLRASIVAGAANNQLASPQVDRLLSNRGILYAPDYVINAGGVINISYESGGYDADKARYHAKQIAETLTRIFEQAKSTDRTTAEVADELARQRLNGSCQTTWLVLPERS